MIVFAKAESSAQLGEAKSENIGAYDSLQPSYDAYQDAIATNSLRADYFSFLALYLDSSSSPSNTEKDFKRAFFLEPNGLNALRYAQWLLSVGRPGDASRALDKGIEIEPNFAKLWNMKAKSMLAQGDIKGAEEAYLRIVSLQNGLVGKVPAIGDVVSLDYLDADIYLGNKAFARKDYKATTGYLSRAEQTLYTYADEKGSNNAMRMSTHHYSPDADGDSLKQSQYAQIADTLIAMAAQQHNPSQVSALSQRKQIAITAFENNIATAKNFKM
jgi:tetratricopeptide (TPR) repeat protein